MAIAKERHGGGLQIPQTGQITTTRMFRVNTGDPANRPTWGVYSIGIDRYDPHPEDSRVLAVAVDSFPVDGQLGWFDVVYTYSSMSLEAGTTDITANGGEPGASDPSGSGGSNPEAMPPTARWSTVSRMVPWERDWDDPRKPLQNTAGQPFEGLEIECIHPVLSISFWRSGVKDLASKQIAYVNKVNDDLYSPIAAHGPYEAGSLRCNGWEGETQFKPEAGGWYTYCTVTFEYAPDGWERAIKNVGYYQKKFNGIQEVLKKITEEDSGRALDGPSLLDANGRVLPAGSDPVYTTFYPYKWVDFTGIYT